MNLATSTLKTIGLFLSILFLQLGYGQGASTLNESSLPLDDLHISTENSTDNRPKIRLLFTSVGVINREILLTVDDRCTDGYDWGFDGHLNDLQVDDMSWLIDDELFVIQGIGDIDTEETSLPLSILKGNVGDVVIAIQALENFPDDLDIILHDNELDTHHDLRSSNYEVTLPAGIYEDRFVLGFQNPSALSIDDNEEEQLNFYYATNRDKLVVLNPTNSSLNNIEIYNTSGQSIYNIKDTLEGSYNEYGIYGLTVGIYIVRINTDDNKVVTKKIVVQ
ncbi:MAG: hypothetical protein Tsb0033_09100 [Winogradskyella sp.]